REQVRAAFQAAWTNIPNAAWLDPEFFILDDNRAMNTSLFRGTDLEGGKHEARMVDLYTFSGDKIAIKSAYRKNRPAVKQRYRRDSSRERPRTNPRSGHACANRLRSGLCSDTRCYSWCGHRLRADLLARHGWRSSGG